MSILIVLAVVALLIVGAIRYLSWLFPRSDDPEMADAFAGLEDADDDEDTMWFDPRGWTFVNRLFGARTERLTYRGDDPSRRKRN